MDEVILAKKLKMSPEQAHLLSFASLFWEFNKEFWEFYKEVLQKPKVIQFPACFRAPVWEIIRWNAADKRGWNLRSSSNSKTASPILSSDQNSPILSSDQNSPILSDQNSQAPKLYVWNSWWGTFWSPKLICSLSSLALQSANSTTGQFANSTTGCTI